MALLIMVWTSLVMAADPENMISREDEQRVMSQMEKYMKDVPLAVKPSQEILDAVNSIQQSTTTPEFQDGFNRYKEALRQEIQGTDSPQQISQADTSPLNVANLEESERIYIFISSSMPKDVLQSYIADVDKLKDPNIIFVMRGFVGGMKYFKPTMKFLMGLLNKNETCRWEKGEQCAMSDANIQIDPMLFSRYGISSVPSFVYAQNVSPFDHEASEGLQENAQVGNALIVSGDASLDYVLQAVLRESDSVGLRNTLNALRKGYY